MLVQVTTICTKVYTTPSPGHADVQGLVCAPWLSHTVLQHTHGRPAATQIGWLGDVWKAGKAIQNLSLL